MSHRARAILIESVPGALKGGQSVHDDYARRYGYRIFRILQNAATFGIPQWRPRFWIIFLRADGNFPRLIPIGHTPRVRTIGQLIDEENPGEVNYYHVRKLEEQIALLRKKSFSSSIIYEMFHGEHFGGFPNVLKKLTNRQEDLAQLTAMYSIFGKWLSNAMRFLDPADFAPVLIGTSCWYCNERLLGENEYKAIMGFPRDYYFPDNEKKKMLEYLSKSVCPPIAAWLISWIMDLCQGKKHNAKTHELFFTMADGETVDFQLKRSDVLRRAG